MNAKNIGILIIIIGAIWCFYTGFNVTTEKVVVWTNRNKQTTKPVQWSPILGVVLIMGCGTLVVKTRKGT
jgi:hypothetical protein